MLNKYVPGKESKCMAVVSTDFLISGGDREKGERQCMWDAH